MSLTSGCQKNQEAGSQTTPAPAKETAISTTPSALQEIPIDPAMIIKPGEPMTAASLKAVIEKLKQTGLAFHNFHDENQYFLPIPVQHPEYYDENGLLKLSWRVHILPYLNQIELYEQIKLDEAWDSPHNAPLAKLIPNAFRSPDTPADSDLTRYRIFEGNWEEMTGLQDSTRIDSKSLKVQ